MCSCICHEGFEFAEGSEHKCEDVNECTQDPNLCKGDGEVRIIVVYWFNCCVLKDFYLNCYVIGRFAVVHHHAIAKHRIQY